jgi:hypothetical protein
LQNQLRPEFPGITIQRIALRIDREPDFFALLRARGEAVIYVATHDQEVIGR